MQIETTHPYRLVAVIEGNVAGTPPVRQRNTTRRSKIV